MTLGWSLFLWSIASPFLKIFAVFFYETSTDLIDTIRFNFFKEFLLNALVACEMEQCERECVRRRVETGK